MIRRIFSDLPTFKEISFHSGLNVLVAEKTQQASDRQTRNGAGKSSLVELIHFALGSDCRKGCIFRNDALSRYHFGIEFDMGGSDIQVLRSAATLSSVLVNGLDTEQERFAPDLLEETAFGIMEWRDLLGCGLFDLPSKDDRPRFGPTFRGLFPYFARRQLAGGFERPERQNENQPIGDQQIAVSYLLGLDWDVPRQLQQVREKEKTIRQLRRAAKEGTLGKVLPAAAELRANLTLAEHRIGSLKERVNSFIVLPEYTEREQEAAEQYQEYPDHRSKVQDFNRCQDQFRILFMALDSTCNKHPGVFPKDLIHGPGYPAWRSQPF